MKKRVFQISNIQQQSLDELVCDLENIENAREVRFLKSKEELSNLSIFKIGFAFALGKNINDKASVLEILFE